MFACNLLNCLYYCLFATLQESIISEYTDERNNSVIHQTEDKAWWLKHGEQLEGVFVSVCTTKLGINAQINPRKAADPTAPDLLVEGRIADLKVQNTPFFSASRYSMNPRFSVTFNRKDYERYELLYPEIDVYFWINWTQLTWKGYSVEPLNAIYKASFDSIKALVLAGAVEHRYIHRKDDTAGNAKSSFVFDVRKFTEIASVT